MGGATSRRAGRSNDGHHVLDHGYMRPQRLSELRRHQRYRSVAVPDRAAMVNTAPDCARIGKFDGSVPSCYCRESVVASESPRIRRTP